MADKCSPLRVLHHYIQDFTIAEHKQRRSIRGTVRQHKRPTTFGRPAHQWTPAGPKPVHTGFKVVAPLTRSRMRAWAAGLALAMLALALLALAPLPATAAGMKGFSNDLQ